jgi:hypothetical protein
MKRYCDKCGYENADKNTFCLNCGAKIADLKDESQKNVKPSTTQSSEIDRSVIHNSEKRFVKPGVFVLKSNKTTNSLAILAIVLSIVAIIFSVFVSPILTLGTGSVSQNELADDSVTSNKIADGSLTDSDINNLGISKIAEDSINSNNIVDNSILFNDINSNTINLLTGLNAIANDSITSEKIANFSINTNDLANNSITGQKIVDGTITESDIADDAITYEKMDIKIKYGLATDRINGSTISHGIGSTPICVIVTPDYKSFGSGNASIHANVYDIGSSSFKVGLWFEEIGASGPLYPVVSGSPVDIYWIAIYTA